MYYGAFYGGLLLFLQGTVRYWIIDVDLVVDDD